LLGAAAEAGVRPKSLDKMPEGQPRRFDAVGHEEDEIRRRLDLPENLGDQAFEVIAVELK
jgi:hypothetical protein